MKTIDVLIIGAGIAGCGAALALAKRGFSVTIMTSSLDQRVYHLPLIQHQLLEEKIHGLEQCISTSESCARSAEQLITFSKRVTEELLSAHYLVDRNGTIDIPRCLKEQLDHYENVDWLLHHTAIELLTLDQHSSRKGDQFKPPSCLGALAFNQETGISEILLAKETILATGGVCSLYPYSSHHPSVRGEGYALAAHAGARVVGLGKIDFHPLGLFERYNPCLPLPLDFLRMGGTLHASNAMPSPVFGIAGDLNRQHYDLLLKHNVEHLWLDLSKLDLVELKETYPAIDNYCFNRGYNIAKDPLPVVPIARYTNGGVLIDRVAQTNVQRLRALGKVAATGVVFSKRDETIEVLESLAWAISCADDLNKYLSKFAYYFPELKEMQEVTSDSSDFLEEDWLLLQQIMWRYVGINRDGNRPQKGLQLLKQLQAKQSKAPKSIKETRFNHALTTACMIAESANIPQRTPLPTCAAVEELKECLSACSSAPV